MAVPFSFVAAFGGRCSGAADCETIGFGL